MDYIMIIFGVLLVLIAVFFGIKWKRTDWKQLDEDNKRYIDDKGNHKYYDRHLDDKF